jgi:hypothetical protein
VSESEGERVSERKRKKAKSGGKETRASFFFPSSAFPRRRNEI